MIEGSEGKKKRGSNEQIVHRPRSTEFESKSEVNGEEHVPYHRVITKIVNKHNHHQTLRSLRALCYI